ncbi:SUMF1/EgtB/PvdO family nonheme iron enzyme [Prosthecomicrobium hirschii]|uniref:SUMF1/EgtB/PvdO family nonheme iron enzyme n=1 Tax=Prosthecodimorpha hirschii TaxID=665126 RepID=UPI001AEC2FF8|nr:SUMF1/EgtB/PvdO family nonheme iron enzyme [Prosthecomicrobium hirschii]
MSRLLGYGLVGLLVALLNCVPALAEKRVALVIGNGSYKAAGRLTNPENDARDMAATLEKLGFDVALTLDADRSRFETAISDFSDKAMGADVALVFYAGHGMGLGSETHLLPVDADFRNEFEARNRTIGLTSLLSTLDGRAKMVIALIDACRDNPLADRLADNMRSAGRSVSVSRGLARIEIGAPDTLVVYATTPGRTAADGSGRNSPFTTALLAHLPTEGVEVEAVLKRVSARVQELTGNKQEPERLSRLKREFYFKPAVSVPTPAPAATDPDAGMRADFALAERANTPEVWQAFIDRYKTGFLVALARQRLSALTAPVPTATSAPSVTAPSKIEVAGLPPAARPDGGTCDGGVQTVSLGGRAASVLTASEERCLKAKDEFRECADCPAMVVIPAGTFTMGSPETEEGREINEGPQRTARIGKSFAVGKFTVSFAEWDACVAGGGCKGYRPGDRGSGRGKMPVINVSWDDAKAYVDWLSKVTGKSYRLLSEAEWEYAARAGTTTPFWWGSSISTSQANYAGNSTYGSGKKGEFRERTVPVDSFAANPFGLYQVHGNVWQWVEDCYSDDYKGAPTDGSVNTTDDCKYRVLRGGSWDDDPRYLRAAVRGRYNPGNRYFDNGFRVARTLTR